jgi:hypothetical protein
MIILNMNTHLSNFKLKNSIPKVVCWILLFLNANANANDQQIKWPIIISLKYIYFLLYNNLDNSILFITKQKIIETMVISFKKQLFHYI